MYMTILAYFLNNTLNWQGKEKHLLNSLYKKMQNKLNVNSKESVSSSSKHIKVKYVGVSF